MRSTFRVFSLASLPVGRFFDIFHSISALSCISWVSFSRGSKFVSSAAGAASRPSFDGLHCHLFPTRSTSIRFPFQVPSNPDCIDPQQITERGGATQIRTTKTDALHSASPAEDATTPRVLEKTVHRSSAG